MRVATVTLLVLLAGCGERSVAKNVESVANAATADADPASDRSARDTAAWQAKNLGPGAWTFHSYAGKLELPDDFLEAIAALRRAWAAAAEVLPEDRNLAAVLAVVPSAREPKVADALRAIDTAYANVVKTARWSGARAPDGWARYPSELAGSVPP